MSTNVPAGVGVDIVELKRFREIRYLSRVAELILTRTEYGQFLSHADRVQYLASRFALKEAVIKAYHGVLTYHDIEVEKIGSKPYVRLSGKKECGPILVSLSHSTEYAAGFALAYNV